MKQCRFIIGWISGSDGACGEDTGINSQADLVAGADGDRTKQCNVYEYEAPEGFEREVGAAKAFKENFTAHDTLSIVQIWDGQTWVD